jgi:hypothetical protein
MAVMLPDCALAVERQPAVAYDANGYPVPGARETPTGTLPGRALERADHSWVLALDPSLWPVREGDLVHDDTGRSWLVVSADLLQNTYDPVVDFVRCEAEIRVPGGTLPPGTNPVGPT